MWVTIILILVVAFFTVLIYRLIAQRREKKVSVTVMSTEDEQAWDLFFKKLSYELPKEFIKMKKTPVGTQFSFTVKK